MKINRKGIKGGIPTVTVVTVGRENRGPSGHGYYCFSLSVDLLRVVAHVPSLSECRRGALAVSSGSHKGMFPGHYSEIFGGGGRP